MLTKFTRLLLLAASLLMISASSYATFHLWRITQLYSNADGSVQFIELTAMASGQQYLAGHTLKSSQGSTTHSYTFTTNLPGDSAEMSDGGYYGMMVTGFKSIVIGTQGFSSLGVVTPDYVVPNGFLFATNGTVNWGEGADVFSYASLPTDGRLALMRGGNTDVNSPKNFNGEMGTVTLASAPMNFQALWRNAPAGTESGWGVNVTHQGDTLFATWFTYDTDGSGMWLVMSNGAKVGANAYSGALYRLTGPAFSAASFDSTQVHLTQVGTATFTFTDENNGTFAYTVNGTSQSKSITRTIFASPVPVCAAGGAPGATPNFQDLWWRSPANSESGWGVNITHQGDILFATWFTYAADGKGLWLVMSSGNKTATNTYSGKLYRTRGPAFSAVPFDSTVVVLTEAGNATFTFSDANNGVFAYTVDGVSQSKPITRDVFSSPATVCK
ncbi:MAG: hypothetical protein ACXWGX_03300 [Usitatibacter sp.]